MKTFKFYSDGGHGWLAVKRKLLLDLGIIHKVTSFSYQKGKTVYLEEDVDAGLFIEAWKAKYGEAPKIIEKWTNYISPIRNYESFERKILS